MLKTPAKVRLHLRSIEELPSFIDEEIADLFREMREATGLLQDGIAATLETGATTIDALERGDIRALPSWPETNRVVVAYAGMLGLDPDPVLRRIMLQLPPEHPRRPKTEQGGAPSYANLRSNIDAALNRIPGDEKPIERQVLTATPAPKTVPAQPQLPSRHERRPPAPAVPAAARAAPPPSIPAMTAGPRDGGREPAAPRAPHGDFRAIPTEPHFGGYAPQRPLYAEEKRKGGLFIAFFQLLLLLIMLASGYAMWLAVNDPLAFADLKAQLAGWLRQALDWGVSLVGAER